MSKKQELLGMNPSTASNRLIKDLLFDFVYKSGIVCYHCGKSLSRENFSIEHKNSWMKSDDPVKEFFDIENISYSHLSCNSSAASRKEAEHGSRRRYEVYKCRCPKCLEKPWYSYNPEKRRATYLRTGK